jgi:N utilization substance protein A
MIPLKREIDQIAKDKGIDKKIIVDALKEAMVQAAHKKYGADKTIEPTYNEETGEVELFEFRTVVEVLTDPETQVLVAKARELDPKSRSATRSASSSTRAASGASSPRRRSR